MDAASLRVQASYTDSVVFGEASQYGSTCGAIAMLGFSSFSTIFSVALAGLWGVHLTPILVGGLVLTAISLVEHWSYVTRFVNAGLGDLLSDFAAANAAYCFVAAGAASAIGLSVRMIVVGI